MPTGYTAKLMSEGQDFNTFVMGCARAMGACVMMRDEPSGTPIPEKFEPSSHNQDALFQAEHMVECLEALNPAEQLKYGESARLDAIQEAEEWLERSNEEDFRLEEMRNLVERWNPPTSDHEGLKDFMLQQIKVSKHGGFASEALESAEEISAVGYYKSALLTGRGNIDYHSKENGKEITRTESRNQWISDLRSSL